MQSWKRETIKDLQLQQKVILGSIVSLGIQMQTHFLFMYVKCLRVEFSFPFTILHYFELGEENTARFVVVMRQNVKRF